MSRRSQRRPLTTCSVSAKVRRPFFFFFFIIILSLDSECAPALDGGRPDEAMNYHIAIITANADASDWATGLKRIIDFNRV